MRFLALFLLRVYKYVLSPLTSAMGIKCRYEPSCSSYSMKAIKAHGTWYGGWMTLARLQRCHPVRRLGGSSGLDNVPDVIERPPIWAPWRVGVWRHDSTPD